MTLPLSVWKWKNSHACHLELWLNRERLQGRGPRCAQAVRCPQNTNNGLLYKSGLIATSDWKRSVLFVRKQRSGETILISENNRVEACWTSYLPVHQMRILAEKKSVSKPALSIYSVDAWHFYFSKYTRDKLGETDTLSSVLCDQALWRRKRTLAIIS